MISGISSLNSYSVHMQNQAIGRPPDPSEMFNTVDSDQSGGVSQTELENWVSSMSQKTGVSIDTTDAVSTYDTNGDGELSSDELKSFLSASGIGGPPPNEEAPEGSDVSATDASSSTSSDSVISQYDTNGDGVLDSDELQAYLDDTKTESNCALMREAISAYSMNFGNSNLFNMQDVFMNMGDNSAYASINIPA